MEYIEVKKINRDKEGEINDGHNPKFWRLENKSLCEMTVEERKIGINNERNS
jgi:hypothetical protein